MLLVLGLERFASLTVLINERSRRSTECVCVWSSICICVCVFRTESVCDQVVYVCLCV